MQRLALLSQEEGPWFEVSSLSGPFFVDFAEFSLYLRGFSPGAQAVFHCPKTSMLL